MDSESNNILLELNLSTLYLRQQRAFAQFVGSNKQGTETKEPRTGRENDDSLALFCFVMYHMYSICIYIYIYIYIYGGGHFELYRI